MFVITQHCFAFYRLSIFQRLLVSKQGELVFGLNPTFDNVHTFCSVKDIPPVDGITSNQYVIVKNHWIAWPLLWQSGLLKRIFQRNVQTVIFEGSQHHLSTWVGMFLLRLLTQKRIIIWTQGITRRPRGIKRMLKRLFWLFPHGMLLYGNRARKILIEEFGLNPDKLYVVFNSLDYDMQIKFRESMTHEIFELRRRKLFKETYKDPILLYVGRLNRGKKLNLLLEAASRLIFAGLPVNILFVGDGDAFDSLQSQAEDLGLGRRVYFYGACYDENENAQLIGCSDLCVAPSHLGLTGMHSLVYGTPVVTHDDFESQMPEFEAIIPGQTGAFFCYDNVKSLAETIQSWLETNLNRDQIRQRCYEIIDKYYNPDMQEKIIEAALEGRPASECPLGESPFVV